MLNKQSRLFIEKIEHRTKEQNYDNVSRTHAYLAYFNQIPEVRWALLASAVSRNAGWNMTTLFNEKFKSYMSLENRAHLIAFLERANWLIFADAYPQLMIYQFSKEQGYPLFSLLPYFGVSKFMVTEWNLFWDRKDEERLCTALIINEQNHLEETLMNTKWVKREILHNIWFQLDQHTEFNYILFPTLDNVIFGYKVFKFEKVEERIQLGKKLAQLLFHPDCFHSIKNFLCKVEHTGSRLDYETYIQEAKVYSKTPLLRTVLMNFHHKNTNHLDWYEANKEKKWWFVPLSKIEVTDRKKWLQFKRKEWKVTSWLLSTLQDKI
ncbi:DUF2515 family protein [Alkalihalobacillus trypoxylicola]|uniref:DUF2515 domain-containing protein n=1 Tax=Alkalihalobacillus trypoxylicola TaxID=519424 RepID=A0A161Q7P0_9BACI|nr:DUF2515 family protein [Alkalihalobacillus trypoxylicola]KYG32899.1 hypothetical protein AZF04_18250 [Alkalihalobacillus trypoxylicola]